AEVGARPGDAEIVVSPPRGVDVLPQHGEAYHPTWSAGGDVAWGVDDRLIVRWARGAERMIAAPRPGGIVFAPVFVGGDVVAAVSAAQTAAVPEDGWSDDLWGLHGVHLSRVAGVC